MDNRRTIHKGPNGEIYKAFTPPADQIKVWKEEGDDGQDVTFIRVPISSTTEDRDGDVFTEDGLERMVEQLESGDVPLFYNHGLDRQTGFFDYPLEDMVGGWKEGEIEDDTVFGIAGLEPGHDLAEDLESRLRNGVSPVAFSVGFLPDEDSMNEREDEGGFEFNDHDLLETSAVGIPSNPDAVVSSIGTAVAKAAADYGVTEDEDEFANAVVDRLRSSPLNQRAITKQDEWEIRRPEWEDTTADAEWNPPDCGDYESIEDAKRAHAAATPTFDDADNCDQLVGPLVSTEGTLFLDAIESLHQLAEQSDAPTEALQSMLEDLAEDVFGVDLTEVPEEDSMEDTETDDGTDTETDSDDHEAIRSIVREEVDEALAEHRSALLEDLKAFVKQDDDDDGDDEDDDDDDDDEEEDSTASSTGPKGKRTMTTIDEDDVENDESGSEEQTDKDGVSGAPGIRPPGWED